MCSWCFKQEDVQADTESDDEEQQIYNPLKLPMGWDGKPIPYWLYKLHGLGQVGNIHKFKLWSAQFISQFKCCRTADHVSYFCLFALLQFQVTVLGIWYLRSQDLHLVSLYTQYTMFLLIFLMIITYFWTYQYGPTQICTCSLLCAKIMWMDNEVRPLC